MITLTTPSSGNNNALSSFDALPKIAPYKPLNKLAAPTPAMSFFDDKMRKLQDNMMQEQPVEEPVVAADATKSAAPAEQQSSSFSWTKEASDLYGGNTPLKRQDIQKQLSTQDAPTVSQKAYTLDPEYRAFVDHYKQGNMMEQLPKWAQDNFDQFALNTHYMQQVAPARMPDIQNMTVRGDVQERKPLNRPELKGGIMEKAGSLARAPITTLALGAKLMINDYENMFRGLTGKESKPDSAVIEEHRAMLKAQDSNLTPETALYWTSKELKFGSAFAKHPAWQAGMGGLGGLGETASLQAMGEPVDMRDYLANITASAALPVLANKAAGGLGATGMLGQFVPQSSWIGRVATNSFQGGAGAGTAGLVEGLGDVAAGRASISDTLYKAGQYGAYGLMFGAIYGTGREIFKHLPIAAGNAKSNASNPVEVNRAEAIKLDPAAEKPIRAGVDPLFVRHAQDSSLDDLLGYKEQMGLTKNKMMSFGGSENTKRSVGEKLIDALKTTFKAKEDAGAALGAMRDKLSGTQVVPAAQVDDEFVTMINKLGVAQGSDGKLVDTYGRLTDQEMGTLRYIWDNMADDAYSARSLDVLRQKINDIFNSTPDMKSSVVGRALLTLKNGATKSLVGDPSQGIKALVPEEYMAQMSKFAEAADIVDDASAMLRLPGDKAMSPSQLKGSLGERELRAGEVAGRLLTNTSGRTEPFIDKLEAYARSQGWEWQGNIRNQALFSRYIERMTGTQQAGSMEGIMKSTSDNATMLGLSKKIADKAAGQAKATEFSKLEALQSYIDDLIQRKWPGSPDVQAGRAIYGGIGENRPVNLKGMNQGTAGIDYPAAPPAVGADDLDDVPLSSFSPQGVADAEEAQKILAAGGSVDDAAAAHATLPSGNTRFPGAVGTALEKVPNTKGFVYHATTAERAAEIVKNGLQPVDGKVFLAPSPDIAASAVGTTNASPVILEIPVKAIKKAFSDPNVGAGVPTFYTDSAIPAKGIKLLP